MKIILLKKNLRRKNSVTFSINSLSTISSGFKELLFNNHIIYGQKIH